MGWFWRPDYTFSNLDGVIEVIVGYTGGDQPNPTYKAIKDHSESVRIYYHPQIVTYEDLLEKFFEEITLSGAIFTPSYSKQYRNVILPHNQLQHSAAIRKIDEFSKRLSYGQKAIGMAAFMMHQSSVSPNNALPPISTAFPPVESVSKIYVDIELNKDFYRAEDYHQKYLQKQNRDI